MADILIIALVLLFITGTTLLVINYLKLRHMHATIIRQKAEIVKQMQQQAKGEARVRELIEKNNQLLRIVSHDLKSPINRIYALIQLIQEEPQNLSENQHEYLGKTHQTIADINSMIRNFLDTRWLDDPALELRAEKINLTQTLNSLVKSFQPLASRKKIQIHPSIAQNVFIYEDKHFLLRILENLMSNAVKFSTENKNIYVVLEEDESNYLIAIRDEGPGINEDDQRKLYQKYSPLSTRPTGGESTTGLGLAIVKSLTDKMGMELKCISQVSAGTTFSVIIDKNKNQEKAIQLKA
ncbi:MAG: HAMP domain-containing histidine kinase [Cyclobacteriaceae bacterium]|jgi:signal transduction histidine kinase|nr:HAMP domain-containing histidine kinase [Cyclobacteriaceae bacterium]